MSFIYHAEALITLWHGKFRLAIPISFGNVDVPASLRHVIGLLPE